ncbi:MAG: hypothetical protein JXB50_02535 [Spirochaetes bacterium]|nr:hypothetical protein [Spirochaetota bacterium]
MDNNLNFIYNSLLDEDELTTVSSEKNNSITLANDPDFCNDISSQNLPLTLVEIELQLDRLKRKWNEYTYLIGQRLKFINDNRLFEEKGYSNFGTYAQVALKMSENNAYYYISIFEFFTEEQTQLAGSKLKLLLPILNKLKRDKEIPDDLRNERIKDLRNELYLKICNKSYREAEDIIKDLRKKYFTKINEFENINNSINDKKIIIKKDRVIIMEKDKDLQLELVKLIENFYNL